MRDPVKLYTVAVVELKNHREAKLIKKASKPLATKEQMKKLSFQAVSFGRVPSSPSTTIRPKIRGKDNKLLK